MAHESDVNLDFYNLIVSSREQVVQQFTNRFSAEVRATADNLLTASSGLMAFDRLVPDSDRASVVEHFLLYAIDCVLVATQLLVRGWTPPSGHMMRQHAEAVAIALLFSHDKLSDFDTYMSSHERYPFHNVLHRVNKRTTRTLLGITEEGWRRFMEIASSYDDLSHPSLLAAGQVVYLAEPTAVSLGGDFDSEKFNLYQREFTRRVGASQLLVIPIRACAENLRVTA